MTDAGRGDLVVVAELAQFLPIGQEMADEIGLGRYFFQVLVPRKRVKAARQIVDAINRK